MTGWLQDLHYALRLLRKSPGFTLIAVVTLAMAIGSNTVVFGVLNGMILRPLHVPDSQSLYSIDRELGSNMSQSYPDYVDLRERNHTFQDLAAYALPQAVLDTGHGPVATWGVEATGNYFDVVGVQPYLGRFFHASDEHGPNSAPFMVLGYAYWHAQFQGDPGVLGRVVKINKAPFTIIGIAPPSFRGTLVIYSPNFYVPVVNHEQVDGMNDLNDRASRDLLDVIGHLKPGVTRRQAADDLNSIDAWLAKTYPRVDTRTQVSLARPGLLGNAFARPITAFMAGLMVLATLILLAACANLGSLFAARAADRSRELALRLALGSGRRRILRGLLTEAVLVACGGGIFGLWASSGLLRFLADWQPFGNFPMHTPVTPDARVYGLALLLTLLSGFLFGTVPVGQVLRTSPYEVVKAGLSARADKKLPAREMLLVLQIATCAVLVTSSLASVRGLIRSLHGHYGFDPDQAFLLDLRPDGFSGDPAGSTQSEVLDAVKAIPGVDAAAFTADLLLSDTNAASVFSDATTDLRVSHATAAPYTYHVTSAYLRAEGIDLVAGRSFTQHDDKDSPRVAIVNRNLARKLFGSEAAALEGDFRLSDGMRVRIVGIVQDGKYSSLTEESHPAMFLPLAQWPSGIQWMVIRSHRNPEQLAADLRTTLHRVDPALPVLVEKRSDEMVPVLFGPQMATLSLGVLGLMGVLLSVTGIFGLAAYSVSKRLRELGIRVALGAQRRELLESALGRVLRLLGIGSAAGLLLGILASRVLAAVVYQATPRDPLVLVGAVLSMALVGIVASWIPARRALFIDPAILLREE